MAKEGRSDLTNAKSVFPEKKILEVGKMTAARKVTPIRKAARTLPEAVRDAVADMNWLNPSDGALVALAERYAKAIEDADDPTYAAGKIGPHLETVLRSLGGAPLDRRSITGSQPEVKGRLADLRSHRAQG